MHSPIAFSLVTFPGFCFIGPLYRCHYACSAAIYFQTSLVFRPLSPISLLMDDDVPDWTRSPSPDWSVKEGPYLEQKEELKEEFKEELHDPSSSAAPSATCLFSPLPQPLQQATTSCSFSHPTILFLTPQTSTTALTSLHQQ